jgi:hypothetical protein
MNQDVRLPHSASGSGGTEVRPEPLEDCSSELARCGTRSRVTCAHIRRLALASGTKAASMFLQTPLSDADSWAWACLRLAMRGAGM